MATAASKTWAGRIQLKARGMLNLSGVILREDYPWIKKTWEGEVDGGLRHFRHLLHFANMRMASNIRLDIR